MVWYADEVDTAWVMAVCWPVQMDLMHCNTGITWAVWLGLQNTGKTDPSVSLVIHLKEIF